MGIRGLAVLLLIASALAAVLWFTDERPSATKVAESPLFEGRSLHDSKRLRWRLHNRAAIELARGRDGRWRLAEPIDDVASAGFLKQILDAWDGAQIRATPLADDAAGRASAGLEPPELLFTAEFADGTAITVELGGPGPLGNTRFVRAFGRIWEGGQALFESLRVGVDDLRERVVFQNAFATAQEVIVDQQRDGGRRETLHVVRRGDDWRLEAPVSGRADAAAAFRFVTAVVGLRVDHFAPGVVRMPEREPRLIVTVRGSFGEESVRLWDEAGQLFGVLPGRGIVFTSDNNQYNEIFDNAVEALRARILLPMEGTTFDELVEFVVDPGQGRGERLRLVRDAPGADWRLVEPVEFAAATTPCVEAAHALQLLVAREFVDADDGPRPRAQDPRYGLGAGRLVVSVRGARQRALTTLWFGGEAPAGPDAGAYACRADEPDTVVVVPRAHVETLRRPWLHYCALRVLLQNAIVERLDLAHADGRSRRYGIDGDHWVREGDPSPRPEVGEFANDELRDLRGVRAVDARGEAFARPDWTLALLRRNGDSLGLLRLWDRADGGPLIAQQGEERSPVAFELPVRVSSELRRLWE